MKTKKIFTKKQFFKIINSAKKIKKLKSDFIKYINEFTINNHERKQHNNNEPNRKLYK
jgi:hypothetical protein